MDVGQALLTSLSGFVIVFILLIFLIVVISVVSKVVVSIEGKNAPAKTASAPAAKSAPAPAAAPAAPAAPVDDWDGRLRLIDCDEKTAACIMAIVSDETKIPLDELQFRRIQAL